MLIVRAHSELLNLLPAIGFSSSLLAVILPSPMAHLGSSYRDPATGEKQNAFLGESIERSLKILNKNETTSSFRSYSLHTSC